MRLFFNLNYFIMAITASTPIESCLIFEEQARDIVSLTNTMRSSEGIGLLEALYSPENTTGSNLQNLVRQAWGVGDGTFSDATNTPPVISVTNPTSQCPPVGDCTVDVCTTTETFANDPTVNYTLDVCNSVQIAYSDSDISQVCEGEGEYQTRRLMDAALRLLEAENDDLLTQAIALPDGYVDGDGAEADSTIDPITLNWLNADGTAVNPLVASLLLQVYRTIGINRAPITVGGNTAGLAFNIASAQTSANQDGVTVSNLLPSFYYDPDLDAEYADGNSHLLTWHPTSLQSSVWLEYANGRERTSPTMTKRTITFNFGGRDYLFDYAAYYSECDEQTIITLKRRTGLFYLPNAADCVIGNGILHFLIACGNFSCADIAPLQPTAGT